MKTTDLMEALGEISPRYITELYAPQQEPKSGIRLHHLVTAGCAAACIALTVGFSRVLLRDRMQTDLIDSPSAAESVPEEPIVLRPYVMADYVGLAGSFGELCAEADCILELTVGETASPRGAVTVFTPERFTVIAGDYQGERLRSYGAALSVREYCARSSDVGGGLDLSAYTQEQIRSMIVEKTAVGCPVLYPGDRIIFFAQTDESGTAAYRTLHPAQGIFPCDDDAVYLTGDLMPELHAELAAQFGLPEQSTGELLVLDKAAFLAAISEQTAN